MRFALLHKNRASVFVCKTGCRLWSQLFRLREMHVNTGVRLTGVSLTGECQHKCRRGGLLTIAPLLQNAALFPLMLNRRRRESGDGNAESLMHVLELK